MDIFGNKFCENSAPKFYCKYCDYGTSKKSSFDDHILSSKHLKNETGNNSANNSAQFCDNNKTNFMCNSCNIHFYTRSGLWKHRKKCLTKLPETDTLLEILKGNSETMNSMIQIIQTALSQNTNTNTNANTTTNNTNINNKHSHNKTFNLNVYLNETCKDAIDIGDFVKSVKVQLKDLENTGRIGYVDGISEIIINNLNLINHHNRPLHCTDEKREIMYIKNDGEWVKETDSKPILTNAIKTIANENIKAIFEWTKKYPDCRFADSKKNNQYLKIVSNSMSGGTKEECETNYNKIIKNIVKKTVVNKNEI